MAPHVAMSGGLGEPARNGRSVGASLKLPQVNPNS